MAATTITTSATISAVQSVRSSEAVRYVPASKAPQQQSHAAYVVVPHPETPRKK